MANYYTTSSSTLASLSTAAYKSSLNFRETKTEIIRNSLFKDLYRSRPSSLFLSLFHSIDSFSNLLLSIMSLSEISSYFLRNKHIYLTELNFIRKYVDTILLNLDTTAFYSQTINNLFEVSLSQIMREQDINYKSLSNQIIEIIKEEGVYYSKLISFYNIIKDNHMCKISDLPDNTILSLSDRINSEKNHMGQNLAVCEIPPQLYKNGDLYRDKGIEINRAKYEQNYSGYLGIHVSNPELFNGSDCEKPSLTRESQEVEFLRGFSLINARGGANV